MNEWCGGGGEWKKRYECECASKLSTEEAADACFDPDALCHSSYIELIDAVAREVSKALKILLKCMRSNRALFYVSWYVQILVVCVK